MAGVIAPTTLNSHATSVTKLNGTNFSEWKEQVEFTLGVLELDMALLKDKPAPLTETSTAEEKNLFNAWEKSDRLSTMFLRMTIATNIKTSLPKPENAKDYMKAIQDRFKTADKSLAGKLMADLTTMKFDGTHSMHEHVIEMTNLAANLKNLGLSVDEAFLVQFILNSLPPQYGPFQIHYNTITDKWTVNELANKLVQEEARLNQQGIKLAHLVQGAGHKAGKKYNSGQKRAPPRSNEAGQHPKKKKKENVCKFCKRNLDIFRQTALNVKNGSKRKGFLTIQTINPSENFLFMGNKDKAPVEAIGTFRLVLDSGYQLDLCQTLYVPSISRNLVSVSALDKVGYSFEVGNGYPEKSKGFRFYCPNHSTRIVETGNAKFFENGEISGSNKSQDVIIQEIRVPIPLPSIPKDVGNPVVVEPFNNATNPINDQQLHNEIVANEHMDEAPEEPALRRSQRQKRSAISNDYILYQIESEEWTIKDPVSYKQAIKDVNSSKWIDAMKDELKSMDENQVWEVVQLPPGHKPVGCKWVFKTKRDCKGNIERHKARLVAKGFNQKEGIDYTETFSPVSRKDSLRIVMALVAHYDLELHQMDVKTAFLNGDLEEEVYMCQPEGFIIEDQEDMVCKLKKSIYGLKQASRQWYLKFHEIITDFDFKENIVDPCIYLKISGTYIDKVLEKFGMMTCSSSPVPPHKGDKLDLTQCPQNDLERKEMEKYPYASLVGSLMYAQVCTKPDISHAVGMLGRFQSNPGIAHWKAAKKVLRYLKGTRNYMLTYRKSSHLQVIGYSDSDFAGCPDTRLCTLGYVYLLCGGAISWKSQKSELLYTSAMMAEYVACYEAAIQGTWLRNFISQFGALSFISKPLTLYCDNDAATFFSKHDRISKGAKHMDLKYLSLKQDVRLQKFVIESIRTDFMVADIFTK
ncbi:Gag-protease-integrase-RT-RNaseH polyprotein [Cinnamomum micranthum f. kanehirae]|uniref:Gag-protease-integrase-RT-RNaseH polyprotein n=1 Tax=Cinnamomum micranthum f. kanehirae TaxID=337451 RepID=A0A3S3NH70_9MAGN|nr:Gag-protease-integrase-RT-RNaseH polyprotein [Cinnamomum micranthum f. kanehirae]